MPRYDKFGGESWHLEYSRALYNSKDIGWEDKLWVDKIYTKSTLKLSEEERLEQLYMQIIKNKKDSPQQG